MFGKKKKEEIKVEEPRTETVEVKAKSEHDPMKPTLGAMLWVEFAKDYNEFFATTDVPKMPIAERDALILNMMFGIYCEQRLTRDMIAKILAQDQAR